MLSSRQIRFLRARAHHCHPLVRIGQNGLTDAVVDELDRALTAHELVKIRVAGADRDARAAWIGEMCARTDAQSVQRIGHTATLFRRNPDKPVIELPGEKPA
jgi:RNA-binding protein